MQLPTLKYFCRTNSKDLMAAMECQPLECLACLSAASSEVGCY